MCHNVLSAVLAGLLDEKVFPLRLSSLGGKSLIALASFVNFDESESAE